jgi:ABC-type sugar transport system substrate-binding protein
MRGIRRVPLVLVVTMLLASAIAACGDDDDSDASSSSSGGSAKSGATFTPAEVEEASKPWGCKPVYDVPQDATGAKLAFINPGPADPYVAAWSAGMKDAASFYGAELKEGFIGGYDFSKVIDTYRTVSAFDPEVVGALADDSSGKALAAATEAEGRQLLFIDTIIEGVPQIGLENVEGGEIMADELRKSIEPLLDGDWEGEPIVVVGVSAEGCVPCDERVEGAFDKLEEFLPEGEKVKYIKVVEKTATTDVIQRRMTDTITANPDANFVVAALDDPSAGGAFNAVRQADMEDRARIASIGGDNLAVENLLKGSPSYVASVDAKPYCEAWNWVEAALALKAGEPFDKYPYTGIITPENVEEYRWRLDVKF